jgi:hypothetical protein
MGSYTRPEDRGSGTGRDRGWTKGGIRGDGGCGGGSKFVEHENAIGVSQFDRVPFGHGGETNDAPTLDGDQPGDVSIAERFDVHTAVPAADAPTKQRPLAAHLLLTLEISPH